MRALARTSIPALFAAATLAGCLDWQGTYDAAARRECQKMPNESDRRACLTRVEDNATQKRADRRSE
ncbi:MAG: hypothetical protein GC155_13675 [Alphaproteobacteria bacterium]|nr:hypothetical protein [Alphaproteobacteria bacterium]